MPRITTPVGTVDWPRIEPLPTPEAAPTPVTVDIESYDFDWDQLVTNPCREVVVQPARQQGRSHLMELYQQYEEMFRRDLVPYQRRVHDAVVTGRAVSNVTPVETPFTQAIRLRRPRSNYGPRPMWCIHPERITLGYMAHARVSPWTSNDDTLYSQELPDHGDRVFPVMKRRGDGYLPLTWPSSQLEVDHG